MRSGLSFRGLYEVFYRPSAFFTELKRSPKLLVVWIAFFLGALVFFHFARDLIVQLQLAEIVRRTGSTPPQAQIELMGKFIYVGAVIFAILPLVLAGLAALVGNFFMGARAKFKQVLSVSLYGEWIFIVFTLILIPLMLAKQTLLVSISPAAFLPDPSPTSAAYVFLSKLGLSYIWEVVALGIGYGIVFELRRNKGYIVAVISIGVMALAQALQTVLFS